MLLAVVLAQAQNRRDWNFSAGWSLQTLSMIEQNINAGGGWTLESAGNYQIGSREAGPLCVNVDGEDRELSETQGMTFGATSAKHIVVAFDNQGGYAGKQFLWINGSKSMDSFTVPAVPAGEKIFIVYESHNLEQERGFKSVTDGVVVDGTDPADNIVESKTIALDTAVYRVPAEWEGENDITFQATAGMHLYRVSIGEIPSGDIEKEKTKIAYLYDPSYEGYSWDGDIIRSVILELDQFVDNKEITDFDTTKDLAEVSADSLMKFDLVVVGSSVQAGNRYAELIKSAIAYVPMLNLSTNLYATWGYGTPVATEGHTLTVGGAAINYPLFCSDKGAGSSYVMSDSTLTLFEGGPAIQGYTATEGYFAADTVLAKVGGVNAIHMHNMFRNAYLMMPYSYESTQYAAYLDDIIPAAINILKSTKRLVAPTEAPFIKYVYKDMQTEVSFSCATPGVTYRYTTDGTDPVDGGKVYEGPFMVSAPNTIVKVVARGDGFFDSEVVTSEPVILKEQVETPVVKATAGSGMATVEMSCATPGAEIYYNYSGIARTEASQLYVEPIELGKMKMVYAFAIYPDMVDSEMASALAVVPGEQVRLDTLAHMNGHDKAYGSGDLVKAYNYYTTNPLLDKDGNPVYDDDGNPVYEPANELKYIDFANGWAVGSYGQRINRQTTGVGAEIGTGTYGPLTLDDFGATDGAMSFLVTKTANDPASAWLQTTVRYQAPFDIVAYFTGQASAGLQNKLTVSVSADSVEWTTVGTMESFELKNIEKRTLSYNGTDEVYVKVASTNDESPATQKTMLFDVLLMNHGRLSEAYDAFVTGVAELKPEAAKVAATAVYGVNGVRKAGVSRGINIVRQTMADGSVRVKKVAVK